jgi:sterol 24-C-methyltransferase
MFNIRYLYILLILCIISYLIYIILNNNIIEKVKIYRTFLTTSSDDVNHFLKTYDGWEHTKFINSLDDFNKKVPIKGFDIPATMLCDHYEYIYKMCSLGSVQKQYIPPVIDKSVSILENQLLFEKQLSKHLNINKGDSVLDIGCGSGRVANCISKIVGCKVYGINIDDYQIKDAKLFAKKNNCDESLFQVHDYNNLPLPFEDNQFDAIYDVQALTYMRKPNKVFKEIFRILKPNGIFFISDVALLDKFNKNSDYHLKLLQGFREVTVAGGIWHYKCWENLFETAGFKIFSSTGKDEIFLIEKEKAFFMKLLNTINFLSKLYIIPNHIVILLRRLTLHIDDMIVAEKEKLITTNWQIIAKKPE